MTSGLGLTGRGRLREDLVCNLGYFPQPTKYQQDIKQTTVVFVDSSSLLNMEAQPDVGKLTEAFKTSSTALATASYEIALVANLPTFNDGQRLFEAIERLNININNLRTDINTLKTDVNTLRTDMNSKFDSLELRMRAESAYFSPSSNFIIMTFYGSLNSYG